MARALARSSVIAGACAAIAILTASAASADTGGDIADPTEAALAAEVAQITQGRELEDLSDEEITALFEILPEDGTTVAVAETHPPSTSLKARAVVAATATSICEVSSQGIWIRKSSGYGAVGTKPTATCTLPFRTLSMSTAMAKRNTFGAWIVQKTFTATAASKLTFTNTDINLWCTNTKLTTWNALTTNKIVMNGGTPVTLYSTSGKWERACGT